jgi:hypothetical protein
LHPDFPNDAHIILDPAIRWYPGAPVLPDAASRAKLGERQSDKFTERYEDYLHLGYLEWAKVYRDLTPAGKKSALVIHTKKNGELLTTIPYRDSANLDCL